MQTEKEMQLPRRSPRARSPAGGSGWGNATNLASSQQQTTATPITTQMQTSTSLLLGTAPLSKLTPDQSTNQSKDTPTEQQRLKPQQQNKRRRRVPMDSNPQTNSKQSETEPLGNQAINEANDGNKGNRGNNGSHGNNESRSRRNGTSAAAPNSGRGRRAATNKAGKPTNVSPPKMNIAPLRTSRRRLSSSSAGQTGFEALSGESLMVATPAASSLRTRASGLSNVTSGRSDVATATDSIAAMEDVEGEGSGVNGENEDVDGDVGAGGAGQTTSKRRRKKPFSRRSWQEQMAATEAEERKALQTEEKERKRLMFLGQRAGANGANLIGLRPSAPRNTTKYLIDDSRERSAASMEVGDVVESLDEHGSMESYSHEIIALRAELIRPPSAGARQSPG